MSTDPTDQMTAQVERFDQLQKKHGDNFADEVINELVEQGYTHRFEVRLEEDPRVEAVAVLGFDGRIEGVHLTAAGADRVAVDPGSGLWAAMEAWLDDFRQAWTDGD